MTTNKVTSFVIRIDVPASAFEKPALEFLSVVDKELLDAIPEFRDYVRNNYYERQAESNDA